MLLNFQTLVVDLTGLPMAVASLLDESSAAAEAMQMTFALKGKKGKKNKFFVSQDVHPQTIGLIETRAKAIGIELVHVYLYCQRKQCGSYTIIRRSLHWR